MKAFHASLIVVGFILLTAAGASRYVNGTEIKQGVVLMNTTDAATMSGALTLSAPTMVSVGAAVSAAGSSKTDATALTKEYNTITGTALQGVSLLTAAVGLHQVVYNNSAVTLIVYPLDAGNDTLAVDDLAALTADVGYAVGPKGTLDCTAFTTTAWHCTYTKGARSTGVAAGTGQTTCLDLTSVTMGSYVAVTEADNAKAVCLPDGGSATTYVPGCVTLQNAVGISGPTGAILLAFGGTGPTGDTINGAAADAVYNIGTGSTVDFCSIDGVAWLTR